MMMQRSLPFWEGTVTEVIAARRLIFYDLD